MQNPVQDYLEYIPISLETNKFWLTATLQKVMAKHVTFEIIYK